MTDKNENPISVKEIKALVVIIQKDKIKMKALEDISMAPKIDCSKMGISKGQTWWELEGDLFQTKEEAIEEAERMLDVYTEFAQNWMAMPVVRGVKTATERFAGAANGGCCWSGCAASGCAAG